MTETPRYTTQYVKAKYRLMLNVRRLTFCVSVYLVSLDRGLLLLLLFPNGVVLLLKFLELLLADLCGSRGRQTKD